MSTSVKSLNGFELVFKRPAIAFGIILIIAAIIAKPLYNTLAVILSIGLYFILYQNRRYIYRMGLGRFDFLALLFYGSFLLSAVFNWTYADSPDALKQISKISFYDLFINSSYQTSVKNWFLYYADNIIHWKMILFSPAFAAILYFIFIECDRKSVKDTDLQHLGITENDLYHSGNIIDTLGAVTYIAASFLYGIQYGAYAIIFLLIISFLRVNLFVIFALIASLGIILINYAHFDYIAFLSIPTRVTSLIGSKGFISTVKDLIQFNKQTNIGQLYILVPYILMAGIIGLIHVRNKGKVSSVLQERAQEREIATTRDAIDFGYEISTGKPIRLTHKELNTHMYINGASGSGKTVAMLNFVIEAAQKKIPLIYIDGKGATDLEEKMSKIAKQYERTFKVFTLSPSAIPNTSCYDFLGSGTFTEKKNRIMELFIQANAAGSAYYQDNLETFINRVFMVINQNKLRIDLFRFLTLISNINDLIELAINDIVLDDGSKVNLKSYFEEIRDMKADLSPRTRIITKLDPFIHSSYGYLFNVIDKQNVINIKQSILNGDIVLFLFDASAFALDTERVAKMVISDLNATFAEFGKEKNPIKTFCCFDEFKSYQTDAISKTISLHRSNGMHAIIGTQSLSLIDKEIGSGILTNCQTHLVMASADADAERFAEEFGTANKVDFTTRIKADVQEVSDIITKNIKDYKIDKQDIKDIRVGIGQGYLHRKAISSNPVKIQVQQKIN